MISSDAEPSHAFSDMLELTRNLEWKRAVELKAPTYTGCRIIDMKVLPSLNILVADKRYKTLMVFDVQTDHLLSYIRLPDKPLRLCLLPGDRAAVLLHQLSIVQILDVKSDQLKLQDRVNVEGRCCGLAYINSKFVVGLKDPQCVALINIAGMKLKSVSKDNKGKQCFLCPHYICVETEQDAPSIYVSDSVTDKITRLSEELEVLQTFAPPWDYGPFFQASSGREQLLVVEKANTVLWVLQPCKELEDAFMGILDERPYYTGHVAF